METVQLAAEGGSWEWWGHVSGSPLPTHWWWELWKMTSGTPREAGVQVGAGGGSSLSNRATAKHLNPQQPRKLRQWASLCDQR